MNHKQRLKEIAEFLQPYQIIWQNEIMLRYPTPLCDYPMEWVSELASIRQKEDIIRLEKKEIEGFQFSESLKAFYQRIEELCSVEKAMTDQNISGGPHTFLYMIPKKKHEIGRLAPFINSYFLKHKCQSIIDIGGGIGLLAQTLANHFQLPIVSLDMDPILQTTGRDRHRKNSHLPPNKVDYQNITVGLDNASFRNLLNPDVLTIGLHTCGTLALDQITTSCELNVRAMINFGCCYNKLPDGGFQQNISEFAKSLPEKLTLEQFALTLAARAHRKSDDKDYDLKFKVKHYRYAIHFLLKDEYKSPGLDHLGNSAKSLYDRPFAEYATEQFRRLGIPLKHTETELNSYYNRPELHDLLWQMQAATLIRNAMGRLLELYLLLDRVIFLEEKNYKVQLLEFFDESLSPRNLGIVASYE